MDYPTSTCLMEVSITYSPYMSEDSLMFGIIIACRGMGDLARHSYRAAGLSTTPSVQPPLPHRLMRLVMLAMGHWRIPCRRWAGAQEGPCATWGSAQDEGLSHMPGVQGLPPGAFTLPWAALREMVPGEFHSPCAAAR